MKFTHFFTLALLTLTLSSTSYAYEKWDCGDDCSSNYCSDCECTDPGVGRNSCIDDRTYCEVFGNVGGR